MGMLYWRRRYCQKRTVGNRAYCVTRESEGAAGSVYTSYTYVFGEGNETIIFTFSLQAVQCANYDNPQKTACEKERRSFDPDRIADQMARSIKF